MKTTEKHSQLNEFLRTAKLKPLFEVDNKSKQRLAGEGPLPGCNFSLGDT